MVEHLNDTEIIVSYRGKKYRRNKDIIGKKLFPIESKRKYNVSAIPNFIKIGDVVKVENCLTHDILQVKICSVRVERRYKRMGGSYYGNSVETISVLDDSDLSYLENIINISCLSPMGKCLLKKQKGEIIFVPLPDNKIEKFKIISF